MRCGGGKAYSNPRIRSLLLANLCPRALTLRSTSQPPCAPPNVGQEGGMGLELCTALPPGCFVVVAQSQSCIWLWLFCNPMDCAPGSSVHGISQTRIPEWVGISYSSSPSPGIEPLSPALVGSFITAEPPGRPSSCLRFGKKPSCLGSDKIVSLEGKSC